MAYTSDALAPEAVPSDVAWGDAAGELSDGCRAGQPRGHPGLTQPSPQPCPQDFGHPPPVAGIRVQELVNREAGVRVAQDRADPARLAAHDEGRHRVAVEVQVVVG